MLSRFPQFSLPEEKSQDPAASRKGGRDRRQRGVLRKLSFFAVYLSTTLKFNINN